MANPFNRVRDVFDPVVDRARDVGGALRDYGQREKRVLGSFLSPKTGVANPRVLKWLFFGGKSPLQPKTTLEQIREDYGSGRIRTPQQGRQAIDQLMGFEGPDRSQAAAIKRLRDEGGLSRIVELAFPEPEGSLATPFSLTGQAKLATGDFREFRDPYTILDQKLGNYLAENPGVAASYMRETDPLSLLPVLIEQDRAKVGAEKDGGIRDIGGRLLGGLKATFVNPFFAADRYEELLGYAAYNQVPDTHLRWQMAQNFYELNGNQLFGGDALSRSAEKMNEISRLNISGEQKAEMLEQWFTTEGDLGMAGMLSDLTGKIIFDPLWLVPLGKIGAVAAKPIKVATGTERLSALLRFSTPAGRKIAGETPGFRAGIRAMTSMPEMAYQDRKWALPAKGLTGMLFSKTPESVASSAQVAIGLPATAAMRQFDNTDVLAAFLDDLNTTAKTGKYTGLVGQRMPGFLENPASAEFTAMIKGLDQDLVDPEVIKAVKEGIGVFDAPIAERVTLARHHLDNRISVLGSREIQRRWKDAGSVGRIITDKLIPYNRATQAVLATASLNTPGFAWLNMVSNSFHVMWNFMGDPITGARAISHSLWTEGSAIRKGGGQYTEWMTKRLAGVGLLPDDVEALVARQSGARELFDIGRAGEADILLKMGDDTLQNAQEAQALVRRATEHPVKHIGQTSRLRDRVSPFVYGASRIDNAFRRAAFVGSLKQQAHVATSASRVSAQRFLPAIEERLINAGVDPDLAKHMEGFIRDEGYGRFIGRRPTTGGGPLNDADVDDMFRNLMSQLDNNETLGGFRSGISYAEDYAAETKGMISGEAQVIGTHDLRDIAEYLTNDILPKLGDELTPNQAARMLRQKVEGYFDAADIGRELGRMESTVRPVNTYSSNLRLTDKALRREMTDTVDTLERFLRAQFFGDEAWLRIPKSNLSPARRFHKAARTATVRNVEGLTGIRKVYDRFAGEGIDTIAGDTPVPKEWLDDLPDWMRPTASQAVPSAEQVASHANVPIAGAEIEQSGLTRFKVGGVEVAVSASPQHPEIMIDIERVSGKGSVSELRKVEEAVTKIVEANPGRPVNAVVRRDLADILMRRGAKEIEPGGNDVGTVLDLTPLGKGKSATPARQLPRDLQGAKPRYNIGSTSYEPQFESDIDKALFIVAQDKKSKRDDAYMAFLRGHLPDLSDTQIRVFGKSLRGEIKKLAQAQGDGGALDIPVLSDRIISGATPKVKDLNTTLKELVPDHLSKFVSVESRTSGDINRLVLMVKNDNGRWTPILDAPEIAGSTKFTLEQRIEKIQEGIRDLNADQLTAAYKGDYTFNKFGEATARPTAPAAVPKTTPSSIKMSDIWDTYFQERNTSWKSFFEEARQVAKGNGPAVKAIDTLEESLQKTFVKHREIISQVPARAGELGNLDLAWREAASKIQRLFARNSRTRPGLLGLTPNDPARQAELLDPQGPLAQEVSDFTEWVIPQLRKDVADLKSGKLTAGASPQQVLMEAAEEMKGRVAEVRQVMVANARASVDHAMLNYNNQYGIDHVMKILFPFSFWPTRQAAHWGLRAARNPGAFGGLVMAMTQPKEYFEQYGYPDRLNVKIPIYMPWLDEFLDQVPVIGSQLKSADFAPYYFVDPMRMLFPYKNLVQDNFDDPARRNTPTGMILDWTEQNTMMGINPFMKIIGGQTGLLDADAWRSFGFQGGPFGIPLTPTARAVGKWFYEGDPSAIPTAETEFYEQRGFFSKGLMGDILGLSPGKFDIYRAERALWALATTGELLPGKTKEEQVEAAWLALDSHTGPAWKNAVKAAESETFLSRFTSYIGFPAGPVSGLQEGEWIWLGLKAAQAEAGRRNKLDEFYEKYPEFEIRSAIVKGISDPKEKEAAIDTELYYQSLDKMVERPYATAVQQLSDELEELRNVEQTVEVREQIDLIETQLGAIEEEKSEVRDWIDAAYPYREKERSLNRDPRERALNGLRDQWYDISWDKAGGEPYEVYQARQQAFLDSLPEGQDPVTQEEMWHELAKESILIKIGSSLAIDQAIKDERFDDVDRLFEERDDALAGLHTDAEQVITRRDFLRYMASFADRRTPEEQEFEQADATFDLWKSLVSSDSPFTSREKASVNAYFRSLPEIQKYFPFDAIQNWNQTPIEVRQAIMTRREFWRTYHAIADDRTKLDYYYTMKDQIDESNAILGIPSARPIEATFIPPEYNSDPLFAHVELMASLQQSQTMREQSDLTVEERENLSNLLISYGADDETFGGMSAEEADTYMNLVAPTG